MTFAEAFEVTTNFKTTENGAIARSSTGNAMLDMFGVIGAMRTRSEEDITSMYWKAFYEDRLLATKMLFYARNCRGGLGERRTFRVILHDMAVRHPGIVSANITNIPHFGRWDDLYELIATPAEPAMWFLIRLQWLEDAANMAEGKPISIMAKWLKSVNASSEKTRGLGRKTARELGLGEKEYRKALSTFREYLRVCEKRMSAGDWKKIEYSEVPSYAMKRYKDAFKRHDIEGFTAYTQSLERDMAAGKEVKINASTLYPMDLAKECIKRPRNTITEAQWKALPNYVEGEHNVLVMADVSGSMTWKDYEPISASIGLAIYFAERNKGAYANKYMTFTDRPSLVSITPGASLADNVHQVMNSHVGYSTNLKAAFMEILSIARRNNVKPEDMPKALIVISDMEIDSYCRYPKHTDFLTEMEHEFAMFGYKIPKVVFWNVEARQNTYHAHGFNPNVQFVSGFSASSFKDVLKSLDYDAYKAMVETLSNPIYDCVIV